LSSDSLKPAQFHLETIEGGITQMVIEGRVEDSHFELFQALSHLSKRRGHVLINLATLGEGTKKFYTLLSELSARTKMKVIAVNQAIIAECEKIGLSAYPTVKSAALSYAGDETISLLVSRLRDVPILNTEAYQLISYVSQPEASFNGLETMIRNKPGLCSQIFRLANSSYYMRSMRADTLQQALVTLGFWNLRQIFIYNFYTSVSNIFASQKDVIQHGTDCAFLAEHICQASGGNIDECSKVRIAGLLHDVGRQALAFFFPDQYIKVLTKIKEESKPSYIAELLIFGTEHQTVGSLLCQKWNFPEYLAKIIADHHYLLSADWNLLTLPVFCANNFLNERDRTPYLTYFQRLEGYFFLKKKELPWKNVPEEFAKSLTAQKEKHP